MCLHITGLHITFCIVQTFEGLFNDLSPPPFGISIRLCAKVSVLRVQFLPRLIIVEVWDEIFIQFLGFVAPWKILFGHRPRRSGRHALRSRLRRLRRAVCGIGTPSRWDRVWWGAERVVAAPWSPSKMFLCFSWYLGSILQLKMGLILSQQYHKIDILNNNN